MHNCHLSGNFLVDTANQSSSADKQMAMVFWDTEGT
jgi:hypothetical protein